jgi:hypothetical protein
MTEVIDRKFEFVAVNPCKGNVYTQRDAIVFCAKDEALIPTLMCYRAACSHLGCDASHLESIDLLMDRVSEYQRKMQCKVPDTETDCEIDRCIGGNLENRSE